ncbi:hypothetical protein [Lysobacter olei]
MNLDPIRPYLDLIRTGLFVAVVFGAYATGCSNERKSNEAERALAKSRITSLETSLSDHIALYDRMNAKATKEKQAAEDQAKRAEEALKVARKAEDEYQTRLAMIQRDLDKSMRDPKCAEQLRAKLCTVLR